MESHRVVSRDDWIEERKALLAREKEFTRLRDQLSQQRRELPWVRVDKEYVFDGAAGKQTLGELFAGRQQLIAYHLMFDPNWEEACSRCSFWADNFNGVQIHLNQRDVSIVAISRAPLAKLAAFQQRMGWSFNWVSSFANDFNQDYQVSFTPDQLIQGEVIYNYAPVRSSMTERPGISVFCKDPSGTIFHTYSCYARGLDMLNVAYHYLDLTPKGRDEAGLPFPMAWVRYHDAYGSGEPTP
ncbi:MAG TPA: thioredoxin family protein [Stellaceae bacterium]|nr:thioredoxin family protein [Stellaceae bacterium]